MNIDRKPQIEPRLPVGVGVGVGVGRCTCGCGVKYEVWFGIERTSCRFIAGATSRYFYTKDPGSDLADERC